MKVLLKSNNKDVEILESSSTLNENDDFIQKLRVNVEIPLSALEELFVVFESDDKADATHKLPFIKVGEGYTVDIPDNVINTGGIWNIQLFRRRYSSTNVYYTETASNVFFMSIGEGVKNGSGEKVTFAQIQTMYHAIESFLEDNGQDTGNLNERVAAIVKEQTKGLQPKEDESLKTNSKKVAEAINEVKESIPFVPGWAQEEEKPAYSYTELSDRPFLLQVGETTGTAYDGAKGKKNAADIEALKSDKQDVLVFDGTYNATTNKVATVKTVTDKIASILANAPEAFDTLEEIASWINNHPQDVAALNAAIQTNKTGIATNAQAIINALSEAKEYADEKAVGSVVATVEGQNLVLTLKDENGTIIATTTVLLPIPESGAAGEKGDKGERGPGILKVTTAPASYTTATAGKNPIKRMSLSSIKKEASVDEVLVGDSISYSYYLYHIYYVDATYAYMDTYQSIRGATGATGANGTNGIDGQDGYTPIKGVDYFTESDKAEIVQDVIADAENFIVTELAKRGQLKPEFANSIEDCTDTTKLYVLPDGYIYGYIATQVEGGKVPNFTNVMKTDGAYVKAGNRYSHSSRAFKECTTDDAIVIPITNGSHTIRVRGAGSGGSYTSSFYYGANNQTFSYIPGDGAIVRTVESNGDIKFTCSISSEVKYCVFHVQAGVNANTLIVTVDEEITYTTEEDKIEYKWKNTGHAFVPTDYEPRIIANERNIKALQAETKNLTNRLDNMSINAGGGTENIVFSLPAFAPVPQKAPTADGGGIMDVRAIRTNTYYEYMDRLVAKHPNYLYKQYMGQDATNTYAHYRYIACRSYYHAWVLDNYPKMYAWKNGNTVVYSVSVSPRVDDVMYSTPYVGISYGKVSVVNCVFETTTDAYGYQEQRKESTRTVNGLEFERYTTADVEPTIVFTTAKREYADCIVYNTSFSNETTVTKIENDVMSCANGKKYTRYPFEDRRSDQSRPLSIFILSNEHAGCNWGDSSIVSIIVAQFLTDMCENKNIPLLRWIKDNCMITTIPIGNPWGYSEDSIDGYNNGNGVNINRNYDTPGWCLGEYDLGGSHGDYAGSESETQHIMNTIHLCNADIGLSMHGVGHHNETPTQGGYAQMQGQAFDFSIRRGLEEILTTSYNLGLEADINIKNDPYHTGKSATYIQWAGAIGGITETVPWNVLTGEYFDSVAMEAGYTQLLLFLQCLIKEALEKLG